MRNLLSTILRFAAVLNVNYPAFGVWKDSFTHHRDAYGYNQKWRKFWGPPVEHSKEGAFQYLEDLDSGDYDQIIKAKKH